MSDLQESNFFQNLIVLLTFGGNNKSLKKKMSPIQRIQAFTKKATLYDF